MLDTKERYLYGTLLALVQEQLEALNLHQQGRLGLWGRGRMQGRFKAIHKFFVKVLKYKIAKGYRDSSEQMLKDLKFIESDKQLWADISEEQLEYIRTMLYELKKYNT